MPSSLAANSSYGSGAWREGRAMNKLQHWHCDGVMHDMLMKLKSASASDT